MVLANGVGGGMIISWRNDSVPAFWIFFGDVFVWGFGGSDKVAAQGLFGRLAPIVVSSSCSKGPPPI